MNTLHIRGHGKIRQIFNGDTLLGTIRKVWVSNGAGARVARWYGTYAAGRAQIAPNGFPRTRDFADGWLIAELWETPDSSPAKKTPTLPDGPLPQAGPWEGTPGGYRYRPRLPHVDGQKVALSVKVGGVAPARPGWAVHDIYGNDVAHGFLYGGEAEAAADAAAKGIWDLTSKSCPSPVV